MKIHSLSLQAFSISEGTIEWLLEDENDRPRYRIRIAEVTPVGKKFAEVTSGSVAVVTYGSHSEVTLHMLIEEESFHILLLLHPLLVE